jgi:hypothetical protein
MSENTGTIAGIAGHAGKWVAILDGTVVDSANTLSELNERIKDRQVDGTLRVAPRRRGAGVFL